MKNNRRILQPFLMLLSCMLLLLTVPVLADVENTESIEVTFPEDAIFLAAPEDLLTFAEQCRNNTWSAGKTVVLKKDIDMTDIAFEGIPTFAGHFYGQGFTIKGLKITADGSQKGLFRYLQSTAVVENLIVEGEILPGASKSVVGGFVGNNVGTLRNCTFRGKVSGYEQIGGIAGLNTSSGVIENCTVEGMVYGSHFIGGIVGANEGIVRNCTNLAAINNSSKQNSVDIEDITLDNLLNTENAATTTDIGGIAGISSGVLRTCENKGAVGYKSMGYNIGGIAGTQNGFVAECVNYADIQGRKEVGGIVGHMEPNIVLAFTEDGLQKLEKQIGVLEKVMKNLEDHIEDTTSDIRKQVSEIEDGISDIKAQIAILSKPIDMENGTIDVDKLTVAGKDLTAAVKKLQNDVKNLKKYLEKAETSTSKEFDTFRKELDNTMELVEHLEDTIQVTLEDVSGEDTKDDTVGKVLLCVNYGMISGDRNIGGIAGIMAEENDLDKYEDSSIYGEYSLNVTGKVRVVIRECVNYGTVKSAKNYAGGIVGNMVMGAVLESVNIGNIDALAADYVGGIAGSGTRIRACSSKCILAGDNYVGGIAGYGHRVTDCYAFVSIRAYTENAGAILGNAKELPGEENTDISGNYYFVDGKDIGGIDGITYRGVTERVDLAEFLALPNVNELLKSITITFITEEETNVYTVNVGESFAMEQIPEVEVGASEEYEWVLVPEVTSKVLGMGEIAENEYLTEENLTNILFSQTYTISYGLKDTVIKSEEKDENGHAVVLAEGSFAKNTTIILTEQPAAILDEGRILKIFQVEFTHPGVTRLHYRISEDMDASAIKLYVQGTSQQWNLREFIMDGSYIVFDFTDGELGFEIVEDTAQSMDDVVMIVGAVVGGLLLMMLLFKKRSKTSQK